MTAPARSANAARQRWPERETDHAPATAARIATSPEVLGKAQIPTMTPKPACATKSAM